MEFKHGLEHCTTKDCTMLKYYSTLTQCYHVFGTEKKIKIEGLHCINFLK